MARQLMRTTPFSDIARIDPFRFDPFRNIEEVMRDFSMMPTLRGFDVEPTIRMDVEETDKEYVVKADMPGMKKEDIQVAIEGNQVTIQSESAEEKEEKHEGKLVRRERHWGQQYRCFSLPQEINDQNAQAHYENGVLMLNLPKKAGGVSKTLAIK